MIRILLFLSLLACQSNALDVDIASCESIGGDVAYDPVSYKGVTGCFILEYDNDENAGGLSRNPPVIVLYSISSNLGVSRVGELPYPGSTGRVDDAFFLDVDNDNVAEMLVIHSADAPSTWEVAGRVYDVRVFSVDHGEIFESKSLSRVFGLGGDQVNMAGEIVYRFPYKNRASVEAAVNSMIASLMTNEGVPGIMKEKSFFYRDASVQQRERAYVVAGDSVVVDDTTAGWCKATYEGKSRRTTAWLRCDAISFEQ